MKEGYYLKTDQLKALIESSKLLNSSLDSEYVLNFLLAESLKHIPGGDAAVIFLYNENTNLLDVKALEGFDDEVRHISLAPNESVTGITFKTRKSLFLENSEAIAKYTKSLSLTNQKKIHTTYTNQFPNITSAISCPLLFENHCLGVIVVDSFSNNIKLTSDDLEFLESISVQATIAIRNLIYFENQIEQKNALKRYTTIIEEQNKNQEFAIELNNQFTHMILQGYSVQDLLNALGNMTHLDVFVLDSFYNISNSHFYTDELNDILKKNRANMSQVLSKTSISSYFLSDHLGSVFFYPIIVSQEVLGWLGVLSHSKLENIKLVLTIERFILVLALELLKDYEKKQVEQSIRGGFLEEFLNYPSIENTERFKSQFGFNDEKSHRIIIFNWLGAEKFSKLPPRYKFNYLQHIYEYLSVKLLKFFPNTLSFIQDSNLIFILELNKVTVSNYSESQISNIFNLVDQPNLKIQDFKDFVVGIGNKITNSNYLKDSYANAEIAIELASKNQNTNSIFHFDFLIIKGLLSHIPYNESQVFIKKVLGPLVYSQKNSHRILFKTLDVYIHSGANWSYTKDMLEIHGNTLTHRLKRIQEILSLDFNIYEDRLSIELALELWSNN